jgi:hypothetical protein
MLKSLMSVAALLGSILAIPSSASYEFEYEPPCFMVTAEGELVDLTERMCGGYVEVEETTASEASTTLEIPQLSGAALQEALDTAAVVFADAFCEARAREGTRRESGSAASSALASYMVSEGISSDNLTPEFIAEAQEISTQLCPELQPTGRYD